MKQVEDLTNKRFGRLLVIKRREFDYVQLNGRMRGAVWICICDCGNKTEVLTDSLKSGHCKSCGCLQRESAKQTGYNKLEDLTNQIFGKLKAIKIHKKSNNRVYWFCECECGNSSIIQSGNLKNGNSRSCGCQRESYIGSNLKEYCISKYFSISEYKIFKNPETGYWLPFDIYIPEYKIFIEIHGSQHYRLNGWHIGAAEKNNTTPEEEFEYQKKKDRMKRKFARKNGVYVEVDLRKIETLEEAIIYIENIIKT